VDSVVFDAPVLRFMAARTGAGEVRTIGPMFNPAHYGFAFREGSSLRKQVESTRFQHHEGRSRDHLNEERLDKK
jgi:polar amino acid transport system substrate-binding protein